MMDETPAERITTRISEMVIVLALIWFAKATPESLPFVTGVIGTIVGRAAGATIATRVRSNTAKKLGAGGPRGGAGGPPSDVPPGGGGSDSPPNMMARMVEGIALGACSVALGVSIVAACAPTLPALAPAPPTPLEAAYAAELLHCVDRSSSREASRACRADVDHAFAPLLDAGAARAELVDVAGDVDREAAR